MLKKNGMSLLFALAMVPATVFAADKGNIESDGKSFAPVDESRISTSVVNGVTADVKEAEVTFTVEGTEGKSDWNQNSGEGSVQTYTYAGVYVTIPEGATKLYFNNEGDASQMTQTTDAFLQGGKYQSWYPAAQLVNDEFELFYGGREYTLLLEWRNDADEVVSREYVKVNRQLADPVAKVGNYTYATLADAVAACDGNNVIELLADAVVEDTIVIDGPVFISGNNHTIKGDNNKAYSAFEIVDGSLSVIDANVTGFGGNIYTKQNTALFNIPASAAAEVSLYLFNVKMSEYNRGAVSAASGTVFMEQCEMNALNSYVNAGNVSLTKDVSVGYGENPSTVTLKDCHLVGATNHPDWSASAVEVYYNGAVKLIGGEIETFTTGVWVDDYYSPAGKSANLTVDGTTITVSEGNDAILVYGEYNGVGGVGGANVNIVSGTFKGDVSDDVTLGEDVVLGEDGVARVDNSELAALVKEYEAKNLKAEDYTKESFAAYTKALADAKAVLADVNATKAEIDAAYAALQAAYKGLKAADEVETPNTGDSFNMGFVALALAAGAVALGAGVYAKKREM